MTASKSFARAARGLRALPLEAYRTSSLVALAVGCAAALPLLLPRGPGGMPTFWLANAVLLVAILRARPESCNRFLFAGLVANVFARLAAGDTTLGGAGHALVNVIEVAAAVALVRWRRGVHGSGSGANKLQEITLLSAIVAPAIGATLLTIFSQSHAPGHAGFAWINWYLRDAFGMAVIVPFGIALEWRSLISIFRRRALLETTLVFGSLFAVDWFVFVLPAFPRLFIIFPVFVFVAFRLGIPGAAVSIVITAAIAAVAMATGRGPLVSAHASSIERLFGIQMFLTVATWTMLPIAAVLRDREALLAQLRERWSALAESHGALEERNVRIAELTALTEEITEALPSRGAVIEVVLQYAQRQTQAVGAVMERLSGDVFVYEAAIGSLAGSIGATVARAGSLSGRCADQNEVLRSDDTESDDRVDRAACRRLNIRSMIVVPIAIDGVVSGVLKVASERARAFDEHHVLCLQLAASHLASAMRAAHEYYRMEVAQAEAQATIENLTEGVVVFGADGAVLRYNEAAERIMRLTKEQLERWASEVNTVFDVNGYELAAEDRPVRRALRTGEAQRDVVIGVGETGVDRRWTSMTIVPVNFADGPQTDRFILSARDVTELQQSELDYRNTTRRLRALHLIASRISHSGREQIDAALTLCREELGLDWGYIGVIDESGSAFVLESSVGTDGVPGPRTVGSRLPLRETLIGRVLETRDVLALPDLAVALEPHLPSTENGTWGAYIAVPITVASKIYGAIGFIGRLARSSAFPESDREFVRITGDLIGSAIERRLQAERLDALAHADALTGLPNRLVFEDRLAQTVLASKRHGEPFAVLYFDLDGFKAINDTYGHGAGDEVLRTVARRLEGVIRESDTVARIGGDEFLILAPKVRSWADASDLAWRVVRSIRDPIAVNGVEHLISASVGASVYPEDGATADEMVKRADAALYRAKSAGKNSVGFARELEVAS